MSDYYNSLAKKRKKAKRESMPEQWRDAIRYLCENCGRQGGVCRLTLHHVVREQHVAREGGDIWDPRNAMTLCDGPFSCHVRHHSRLHVIPSHRVPQAAIDFAVELFGPERAYEYLRREYLDAGTHRFDVLLEDAA